MTANGCIDCGGSGSRHAAGGVGSLPDFFQASFYVKKCFGVTTCVDRPVAANVDLIASGAYNPGMDLTRKVITILTLVAVAANPAAAGLRACCCLKAAEKPAHDCCAKADSQPSHLEPASCCAAKDKDTVPAFSSDGSKPTVGDKPCCCVKPLPATPPAQKAFGSRLLPDDQSAHFGDALVLADFPAATIRIRQHQPGLFVPSAPPLSVLYCVWLK
jgi:hypothetical protein